MKKVTDLESRVVRVETILVSIAETLARLDSTMIGIDHVIRGNGAPGLAQKVGELKTEIKDLKGDKGMLQNAIYGAVGGLTVGLVMFLIQHFFR